MKNFKKSASLNATSEAMGAETISKNAASPKSQMSRNKIFATIVAIAALLGGCQADAQVKNLPPRLSVNDKECERGEFCQWTQHVNCYEYDNNGKMTLDEEYKWDYKTAKWEKSGKTQFNSDSVVIFMEKYSKDYDTNKWYTSEKLSRNGNRVLHERYGVDDKTKALITYRREIQEFDSNGNLVLGEEYMWDDKTKAFKISHRVIQEYNSNGKLTLSEEYRWDDKTKALKINQREIRKYDSNGSLTYEVYGVDYKTKALEIIHRDIRKLDSNGKLTLSEDYRLDDKTKALVLTDGWKYEGGKEYSFDSETKRYYNKCDKEERNKDGKITLSERYSYDSKTNKCKKSEKREYGYDEKGNNILSIFYKADNSGTSWIPESKSVKKYNSNGKEILSEYYEWNAKTNKYKKIEKKEFNSNGKETLHEWYNATYKTNIRDKHEYNSDGKETLYEHYLWDSKKNAWIIEEREKHEYNSYGDCTLSERWLNNKVDDELDYGFSQEMESRCKYKYDSNGKLLSSSCEGYSGNCFDCSPSSFKSETKYDSKGNVIVHQSAYSQQ